MITTGKQQAVHGHKENRYTTVTIPHIIFVIVAANSHYGSIVAWEHGAVQYSVIHKSLHAGYNSPEPNSSDDKAHFPIWGSLHHPIKRLF